MNILLVVATQPEIAPLLLPHNKNTDLQELQIGCHAVTVLITGAGMVPTAFALGKQLALYKYDLAINGGIAGSFNFSIPLGEVVLVTEDVFAEHGAEDGENFLSIDEMGFGESSQFPNSPSFEGLNIIELKKVKAITVNKVHGNEQSIEEVIARVNPQIESMEGAAFFYACNQFKTPSIQIRSISNYVERRNREKWNIGLAIKNLNDALFEVLAGTPAPG
jgi:futalosine hydrolase